MTTATTPTKPKTRTRHKSSGLPPMYEIVSDVQMYVTELQRVLLDESLSDEDRDERINALASALDESNADVVTKLGSIRAVLGEIDAECLRVDAEIERLRRRKQVRQNESRHLHDRAMEQLDRLDNARMETDLFTMGIVETPWRLVIDNEDELPSIRKFPSIWKHQPPKLDKNAAKAILLSGDTLPGCHVEKGRRLKIS